VRAKPDAPREETTVAYIIGRYRVLSYPEWRRVLDEKKALLRTHGVTDVHVFRNEREPDTVLLLFEGKDVKQLRATWDSGVVRNWRQEAGSLQEALFVEDP
jgi:hypothetical protein